mmetsp:Transcript_33202/g.50890  ORF Transcript_33202/g.50890 Transcript_33202/m.50890 type:complete len:170 (+) Transcript_33202:2-511(+)
MTSSSNDNRSFSNEDPTPPTAETCLPVPNSLPTLHASALAQNQEGPAWVWDMQRDPTSYFCKTRQRTIESKIRPSVPPGAFCIFSQECKARIRKVEPNLRSKVLMKKVQKEWRKADQKHYKHVAAELYSDYRLLLSWWRTEYAPKEKKAEEPGTGATLRRVASEPLETT